MLKGFEPLGDEKARVLILGTMPSAASLQSGQYYGNPHNAFWPLLYSLWEEPLETDYGRRLQFLREHEIALWDVLAACEREGSADAAIRKPSANDFAGYAASHPRLQLLAFNSRTAERLYQRLVKPDPFIRLHRLTLPSSSPARAMRFEEKREAWLPLRHLLQN